MWPLRAKLVKVKLTSVLKQAPMGRLGNWRLAALAVGILTIVALAQTPLGRTAMNWTGVAKPPVAYSELYFTNSSTWPSQIPPGHFLLPVSFAVHNATQATKAYHWTIQTVTQTKVVRVVSGQFSLPAGARTVTQQLVTGTCVKSSLQVVVGLASPAESIVLRTACRA